MDDQQWFEQVALPKITDAEERQRWADFVAEQGPEWLAGHRANQRQRDEFYSHPGVMALAQALLDGHAIVIEPGPPGERNARWN